MIVDSTNPRIMANNIRELARNGGGSSGVSHYKVTSGAIEGTFAEVLADLTAGKLVCIDVYANGSLAETFFRDGRFLGEDLSSLGFYTISSKIEKAVLSSDGSFTVSRTFPLVVDYSTTEKDTGRKWIDGRPVYSKVIHYQGTPASGDISIPHGITNLDTLLKVTGTFKHDNKDFILPYCSPTASYNASFGNNTSEAVVINAGGSIYSWITDAYIFLEYIKTPATTETKKRKTTKGEN